MKLEQTLAELGGLSLIHPFYNDEKRLELQIENWMTWPEEICKLVDITLVDDYSKVPLMLGKNQRKHLKRKGFSIHIYRIVDNLKWNTPGALNLGFTVAPKRWALTMDSDCFFDAENIEKLVNYYPHINHVHKFKRKRYGTTESANWLNNDRWLPCTMLMSKEIFWHTGGFDEDFTGEYTGGYGMFDTYFDRCAKWNGYRRCVVDGIVAGEWLPSISGDPVFPGLIENINVPRKEFNINKRLHYSKVQMIDPTERDQKILRFRWRRVL